MKFKKYLPILLISLSMIMTSALPVYAALVISPSVAEISFNESGVYEGVVEVQNTYEEAVKVKVDASDWSEADLKNKASIDNWLKIDEVEFSLEPNETKKIKFQAILDDKRLKGERFAQIFFGVERGQITSRIGMGLYLASKKTVKFKSRIEDVTISFVNNKEDEKENLMFFIEITNLGNVHIRPKGEIVIFNRGNGEITRVNFGSGGTVFPNETKKFYTSCKNVKFAPGRYVAKISLDSANTYEVSKIINKSINFSINDKNEVLKK